MIEEHIKYVTSVTQPELHAPNPWTTNSTLRTCLSHTLKSQEYQRINQKLIEFGEICNNTLNPLALDAEINQPQLVKQNVYGKVVDQLRTTEGWRNQKQQASKLGVVATGYSQEYQSNSRLIQLMMLQMYQPVSGLYGCPLAMTDGAAYLLSEWIRQPTTTDADTSRLVNEAFNNLTSVDPNKFWTSGQWMTEKEGGSDVSMATTTIAIHQGDNKYKLYGYKWFSSATDSDIAITLARIIPKDITYRSGDIKKYPLSTFILRVKNDKQELNGITIMTLKDKLGTRQLPTAELLLNGTEAYLISEQGKGIKGISYMLNVTRLYNASCAVGNMNRMYQIVLDYSNKRKAFGQLLSDLPAHQTLLTNFSLNVRACNLFYFKISHLFSRVQSRTATKDEQEICRIMTPLLKLYTAKMCVEWMSEGIEALGALGYMENSNIPVMLRDSQVLTIWEGTTNVLCLDFLRALQSTDKSDPLQKLDIYCRQNTHVMMTFLSADTTLSDRRKSIVPQLAKMANNHNGIVAELSSILRGEISQQQGHRRIRELCIMLTDNFIGGLLLDMISRNGLDEDVVAFELWMSRIDTFSCANHDYQKAFKTLVNSKL